MKQTDIRIDRISWLSGGVLLAGLPHWGMLPIWVPLLHTTLILARLYIPLRYSHFWHNRQNAINNLLLFVVFSGLIGIYSAYGSFAGRDVSIALLVMLSALKLFESRDRRDFYIGAYLGYFLAITNFFYEQAIPIAIFMFAVTIIITASLIGFNDTGKGIATAKKLRLSCAMLLQSLPLLLVLFILFPRIDGPLWSLPKDALTSITGIDDQMAPGSISRLIQSNEIAFRARFTGATPDVSQLYWRGPVLWQTDGNKWTQGIGGRIGVPAQIDFMGEPRSYNLMLESTNKKWIFALEMAGNTPHDTYLTNDFQLQSKDAIQSRKTYDLIAYTKYRLGKGPSHNLFHALALPERLHPRTRALAAATRKRYREPEQIIAAALDWFREQGFIYTLTPPVISGDTVDDFLFDSRQGFCEHYAAAFAVLMRAAGIPARIITGYQGGEINPVGNYLVVRQYHAHAWTEVWLENKGWTRVDPTHAVSPTRIDQGIERVLPDATSGMPLGIRNDVLTRIWRRISNSIDTVNYQWSQWVLGYGPERQQQLMQLLGMGAVSWKQLILILFTALAIVIALLSIHVLSRKVTVNDPARRAYDQFCRKLAHIGLARRVEEGPHDYAQRIGQRRKDLAGEIGRITELYIDVRYRSQLEKLRPLQDGIKKFKAVRTAV